MLKRRPASDGALRRSSALQVVARADIAGDPDRQCRMEIAAPHPARRHVRVDGAHRTENSVGPGRIRRHQQFRQPIFRRCLIVIDKGHEIAGRMLQAGITGNRNVRSGTVHIGDLGRAPPNAWPRRGRAHSASRSLSATMMRTESVCRNSQDRQGQQCLVQFDTAIGADGDIDPHGPALSVLCHDITLRPTEAKDFHPEAHRPGEMHDHGRDGGKRTVRVLSPSGDPEAVGDAGESPKTDGNDRDPIEDRQNTRRQRSAPRPAAASGECSACCDALGYCGRDRWP